MPEQLLQAVHELTEVVKRLENALMEYPKRREVEDRFATKDESKKRASRVLLLGVVMMLVSLAASYFVTITTVGACFISDNAREGRAPAVCNLLPGYPEAQEESRKRIELFNELVKTPDKNSERLDRIEKKLGISPEGNN